MIPWLLVDTAQIPGSTGDLRLMRRGDEFSIRLDGGVLMGSRMRGSEEALATLACARIAGRSAPRVLVGGLGMGFTLRAALDALGPHASVVVAELIPAVVRWVRGPLAGLAGDSLADPRVTVQEGDVGQVIRSARASYDAILLDVDNGPEGMTRDSNDALYGATGLHAAWGALRPGGVLAVWSAGPDPGFARALHTTGFAVEEVPVRAHGRKGLKHMIWLAGRPETGAARRPPQAPERRTRTR